MLVTSGLTSPERSVSHQTLPINNDNMKWYKIYLNGENRIWKKCITYSWEFIYEDKKLIFKEL